MGSAGCTRPKGDPTGVRGYLRLAHAMRLRVADVAQSAGIRAGLATLDAALPSHRLDPEAVCQSTCSPGAARAGSARRWAPLC
jgi:hypothetical protein